MNLARARRRGFTLIELIAAITIIAVLATLGSGLIWQGVVACRGASCAPQLHSESAAAMDRLVRELRCIELRSGVATPAPNITSITATSMIWTAGGADAISLSGTDLMLTEDGGTPRILLRNVQSLQIGATNQSGVALSLPLNGTSCDSVRCISIRLTVSREGVSDTLRTRVFIRSLVTGAAP
jgi:prepilin-type N-terminal cleavage/methylation domain-containing protein